MWLHAAITVDVCREEMLAIAPQCQSLPDGLGTIPENLSSLFDVGQSSSVRARGKGRTGVPAEMGGRKRAEESSRTAEQTSAWRKKERVSVDMPERVERYVVSWSTALFPQTPFVNCFLRSSHCTNTTVHLCRRSHASYLFVMPFAVL